MQRYSNTPIPAKLDSFTPVTRRPVARRRIHRAATRLGSEAIEQLVADYQAGASTRQLMVKYHLGKGTVLRILESHGIERRNQPMTPEQCTEAAQLYQQGWSLARVGEHFDRDPSLIRLVLERIGVPRRDTQGRDRR